MLDFALEAHAQRVVAGKVGRFAHQEQAVLARLQQMLGLVPGDAAMKPSMIERKVRNFLLQSDKLHDKIDKVRIEWRNIRHRI